MRWRRQKVPGPDVLWISITRQKSSEPLFHVHLEGVGVLEGGLLRRPEPFRSVDVQALRRHYEQEIQLIHQMASSGAPPPPLDDGHIQELGRRVAAVLPRGTRHSIAAAVLRARHNGRALRMTLEVDSAARELLSVPWELMALPLGSRAEGDNGEEGFPLLDGTVTLIRQVRGVGHNTVTHMTRPLQLLVFAAAPIDVRPIDVAATRKVIGALVPPGALAQHWYDGPNTLDEIQRRLAEANPQIVHLLCHGEQQDTGRGKPRSDLLLTHADGYMQRASATDLASLLTLASDLQLVVLQACHAGAAAGDSGAEGEREATESIALALVRSGVPAIVAMQGEVGQAAAAAFVRACYTSLGRGHSLDHAVAAGRIAMRAAGGAVDWSLPVVYQGSGRAEAEAWHTRLADRFERVFYDPPTARGARAGVSALALALLLVGVARWLLFPGAVPPVTALFRPLAVWAALGITGPAAVACLHHGARDRSDLSVATRRAAVVGQWIGAYLGYALGGLWSLALLAALWMAGILPALPVEAQRGLFIGGLAWALFASYVGARAQVRSALAIAPVDATLFGWGTLSVVLCGSLIMLAAPFGIAALYATELAPLLEPGPGALALAFMLILLVLGSGR